MSLYLHNCWISYMVLIIWNVTFNNYCECHILAVKCHIQGCEMSITKCRIKWVWHAWFWVMEITPYTIPTCTRKCAWNLDISCAKKFDRHMTFHMHVLDLSCMRKFNFSCSDIAPTTAIIIIIHNYQSLQLYWITENYAWSLIFGWIHT